MKLFKQFKSNKKDSIVTKVNLNTIQEGNKVFVSKGIRLDGGRNYLLVADYSKDIVTLYREIGSLKETK